MLKLTVLNLLTGLVISNSASAQNISVVGTVYKIQETDALIAIKEKAKTVNWKKFMTNRTNSWLKNQQTFLPFATENTIRFHKPLHQLQREIKDQNGQVIYPAGFEFNPLEFLKIPFRVIAISYEQLGWLKDKLKKTDRVLLTNGDVFKARDILEHQVFLLDPPTRNKFNLLKIPSIIKQKGMMFEIEEFKFIPTLEEISEAKLRDKINEH